MVRDAERRSSVDPRLLPDVSVSAARSRVPRPVPVARSQRGNTHGKPQGQIPGMSLSSIHPLIFRFIVAAAVVVIVVVVVVVVKWRATLV